MHKVPRICLNVPAEMLVGNVASEAMDMLVLAFSSDIIGCVTLVADRDCSATTGEALKTARHLRPASGPALCVVGCTAEAARNGADAVLIEWSEGAVAAHRALAGAAIAIGVDCGRSLANAITADGEGADFVRFGPFFPKDGTEADAGIIDWWRESMSKPVIVGGGTNATNAEELIWSGADFVELELHQCGDAQKFRSSLQTMKLTISGYIE